MFFHYLHGNVQALLHQCFQNPTKTNCEQWHQTFLSSAALSRHMDDSHTYVYLVHNWIKSGHFSVQHIFNLKQCSQWLCTLAWWWSGNTEMVSGISVQGMMMYSTEICSHSFLCFKTESNFSWKWHTEYTYITPLLSSACCHATLRHIGNMKLVYSETSIHCSHMHCFHAIIIHFFQSQKITPMNNVNVIAMLSSAKVTERQW